jgi:hypothetical protein
MASMRELAMELLSRAGSGPVLQPTNVFGQDPDLPIGYGEGEISPLDAAAMSTMLVPGVGDVTGLAADVDMYMRDPESRNIPNYLLTAAGVLPFLPAASQVRKGIKAYHGSPYDFDRFSTEQIGTGEGAQAYGRGLYFAESEDVARGYRDALASRRPSPTYKGRGYDQLDGPEYRALSAIEREVRYNKNLSPKQAKEAAITSLNLQKKRAAENIDPAIRGERLKDYDEDLAALRAMSPDDIVIGGSMYEVNIDVEPDELLDWDKPMAEQSALVKQAFNFDPPPKPNFTAKDVTETGSSNPSYKYSVGQFPAAATVEEALRAANKPVLMHTGPTGSVAYKKYEQALSDPMSDPSGAITAAQKLQEKGIKGIRYADAFTRHKTPDKRSMNYVIFDDRLITIAKKYGVAIPVAAAMLAKATGEDTSQSYQEET